MRFLCSCNGLSDSCPRCNGSGYYKSPQKNILGIYSNATKKKGSGRACPYCDHRSINKNERLLHVFHKHEEKFVKYSGRPELIKVCDKCGFKTIRKKVFKRHKCSPKN